MPEGQTEHELKTAAEAAATHPRTAQNPESAPVYEGSPGTTPDPDKLLEEAKDEQARLETRVEDQEAAGEERGEGEGGEGLRAASDDEVRDVLKGLESSGERTQGGQLEMSGVNEALRDKGFAPIKAADRDRLAEAPAQ